jgi:hypothetical protein
VTDWCEDVKASVRDFIAVAELAGEPIAWEEIGIECLPASHRPPSRLPAGTRAVYGFWRAGSWLKIGKAGPKSQARYTSQHYNVNSSQSNFGRSLMADPELAAIAGSDPLAVGEWIRSSTNRVNILLPVARSPELLSLLEAFLHARLRPRFEGKASATYK